MLLEGLSGVGYIYGRIRCFVMVASDGTNSRAVYEKLRDVISENKELEKMVSAGRVEQLGMEIGLLKRENEGLREVVEGISHIRERNGLCLEYKRALFEMDEDLEKVVAVVKEYQAKYGELEE
jgi:protein subunit release factor A